MMQESVSINEFAEISGKLMEDFDRKVKLNVTDDVEERIDGGGEDEEVEEEDEEEEEEEFSFSCVNPDKSPISADDVFQNGQIRTSFPMFDQNLLYDDEIDSDYGDRRKKNPTSANVRPPLKKLFVEERSKSNEDPAGPYCDWRSGKTVKEASPEACKKSNSTGFSKLWRFRELVSRSSSDGKDAFVFLNNNSRGNGNGNGEKPQTKSSTTTNNRTTAHKTSKSRKQVKKTTRGKKSKPETVSSVYEKLYLKKDGDKRKSYQAYRQDVVGFFTNVNGLSKNVHPY